MPELGDFLAVIGDYEMQRRDLISANERLAALLRAVLSGEVEAERVDPETFEIAPANGKVASK